MVGAAAHFLFPGEIPMSPISWLRRLRFTTPLTAAPRRPRRAAELALETLESRCLLAVGFTEFTAGLPAQTLPGGITTGPDGNLWFTDLGTNAIGRITPAGVITEFPLAAASDPGGITTGPDGNLWFTELGPNKIGRITTAGVVSEFATPTPSSDPTEITTGPDGNLWFTEQFVAKIGRITPTGVFNPNPEFSTGITSGTAGITAGPDGNLWFTEYGSAKVGRITPTGTVTEFATGTQPNEIAAGPDGSLWFAETGSAKVGRISTGGNLTEFTLPAPATNFDYGMRVGPDGNLWSTDIQANLVYRITPLGAITAFPIPLSNSRPQGITMGPDGNLWIAQQSGAIARLSLLSATAGPVTLGVGTSYSGPVATVQTFDPGAAPTDFIARVDWGDGTSSAGTLTVNPAGQLEVDAAHSYQQVGSYMATATVFNAHRVLLGINSFAQASFPVTVGPATHLAFLQQPDSTFAGQALSPAVTVAVVDSNDSPVFSDNSSTITLSLGTNADGATLSGTVSAPVIHGIATFSNLSLNRPGNGYTLLAADGGLVGGQSAPFTITALDVAVGSDNQARLLWDNVDGVARFWSINNTLQTSNPTDNGPFVGFTAQKIAAGADGLTRVLWTRSDGLASLWLVNSANVVLSSGNFGPFPGYTAVDVTVGNDNKARLLWDNVNGQASVWTVDNSFTVTNQQFYGPFAGFTAQAIAAGSDGLTRLLWNSSSGVAALWLLNTSNALISNQSFGPFAGLTALDVTVGSDSKARLLWDNVNGQVSIWTVDNSFNVTNQQFFGPFAGFLATALEAGTDGLTRLVWDALNGSVVLTLLNADNTLNSSTTYPPWVAGTLPVLATPAAAVPTPAPSPAAPVAPAAVASETPQFLPVVATSTATRRPVEHRSAPHPRKQAHRHETAAAATAATGHHAKTEPRRSR
jgi:streptogramin lyase